MLSVSKEPNHPDFGNCLHAGARGFPYQNRNRLDYGSLASAARHCNHRRYRHNRFPYLEAQA